MRKYVFCVLSVVFALTACKNDAKQFLGDYSYKTSGSVTVKTDSTTFSYRLADKIGQLDVVDLKSSDKDSVLLVMNEMGGGVTIIRAGVSGDSVFPVPYMRALILNVGKVNSTFNVQVSGSGVRYDETIVLNEIYDGALDDDSVNVTIYGNDICTVAEKN
jgi:uncharacterized lipoprotein NlpE involved in copper resistance